MVVSDSFFCEENIAAEVHDEIPDTKIPERFEKYLSRKAEHCIDAVFKTLWFSDVQFRDILYDSYMANIPAMNQYIIKSDINPYNYYFTELREILLKNSGVRNYLRKEK